MLKLKCKYITIAVSEDFHQKLSIIKAEAKKRSMEALLSEMLEAYKKNKKSKKEA